MVVFNLKTTALMSPNYISIERNCDLGMDALVSVCSSKPHGIITGHGCSGWRMLFEPGRNYGLGMDALVSVGSSNTHGCNG